MTKQTKFLPIVAGLSVSLIFGFSFLFSKDSLTILTPLELLAHRFTLAASFLIILAALNIIKVKLSWKLWRDLIPLVLFQPIGYFLGETAGVKLTSASESGLLISLIPIAVTAMGSLFLREKAGWRQWSFIILSVAGVIVIVLAGSGLTFGMHTLGIAALLGAVLTGAVYNILSRKLSTRYSPLEMTMAMMLSGAVFFNVVYFLTLKNKGLYFAAFTKPTALIGLGYLGILSSVIAFFMLNYMLSKMPVSWVANFINLTTIVSIAAGVIFRGESFGWAHMAGGILIIVGVWGTSTTQSLTGISCKKQQSNLTFFVNRSKRFFLGRNLRD